MKEEVRKGYQEGDYIGEYRKSRDLKPFEKELFYKMFEEIPEGGSILDLGCGNGVPFDRYLVDNGYDVTGIEFIEKHVRHAREEVPEASFRKADFTEIDEEPESYDAVVSFFAIFHVPKERHSQLLEKSYRWLKEGGCILVTLGAEEDDSKDNFVGSEMLWSSYSMEKNRELVEETGFDVLDSYEEKGDEHHFWVLAEK